MIFDDECDLLIGNKPENDSDIQYDSCESCYRYNICNKYFESHKLVNSINNLTIRDMIELEKLNEKISK